jgi:hypothetical protein
MMSKNSGIYSLENLVRVSDPSRRFLGKAPSGIDGVGHAGLDHAGARHVGGVGNMNTDAAEPPSGAELKRAAAEPSPPRGGVPEEEPEYEVNELIYERTGTLCFPWPSLIVEGDGRALETEGARPEAKGAPPVGSDSPARSSIGCLVRDLRAASAGTPGVLMLATVDGGGVGRASTVSRREPSTPPALAEAKGSSPSGTSFSRAGTPLHSVRQRVDPIPAFVPLGSSSMRANRAVGKVAQTSVASASRDVDPSRGREALEDRPFAPDPNGKRSAKPIRLIKHYPSLGQRILTEVRRTTVAQRIAALGVLAAGGVLAAVVVASSTRVPVRVPVARVAPSSSVAPVVAETAPTPPPAHVPPSVPAVVAEAPPEPPNSMLANGTPLPTPEETLPEPSPLSSKEVKATSRSKSSAPTRKPCDCVPGDPLCECLD